MTQRSVLTTQSKLTVQATGYGERGSRHMRRPWRNEGRTSPIAVPYLGCGRFNGSLLTAYEKTSRSCHTASRAWV
ncbi:hypothetical protein [Desulfosporosinus fructosivorans]